MVRRRALPRLFFSLFSAFFVFRLRLGPAARGVPCLYPALDLSRTNPFRFTPFFPPPRVFLLSLSAGVLRFGQCVPWMSAPPRPFHCFGADGHLLSCGPLSWRRLIFYGNKSFVRF